MGTDSYADVVERLFGEFDWALSLPEIARLVGQCRQLGTGTNEPAGLENDARQRLTALSLVARPVRLSDCSARGPWGAQPSEIGEATLEPA